MNCQTWRQNLQPFLDDELSVNENVEMLEHVTACGPCQDIYGSEKRIAESLRARLSSEKCPAETENRLFAMVRQDARSSRWGGSWRAWIVPAAAAVLAVVLFRTFRDDPPPLVTNPAQVALHPRLGFAVERTHDHSMHGEFLAWAGARYDELYAELGPDEVLTEVKLRKTEPRSRSVSSPGEFVKVVKAELGRDFKLPPGFLNGGRIVGGELLKWHEGLIQQVIVEYGDRDLALYEISGCHAKRLGSEFQTFLASLHPIESDPSRQVNIFGCKGCDAVLVVRNNRTYLLISRNGRDWDDDWMLDRARKLVD